MSHTVESIIAKHADGIAFVAEETPATTLDEFLTQLAAAEENLDMARLEGSEELGFARTYLVGYSDSDNTEAVRETLLAKAAQHLTQGRSWVDEYRDMV